MSESYWWCPECKHAVDGMAVTFEERHVLCGAKVMPKLIHETAADQVTVLEGKLIAANAEIDRLREALKRLMWERDEELSVMWCRGCSAQRVHPHQSDCWIDGLLNPEKTES